MSRIGDILHRLKGKLEDGANRVWSRRWYLRGMMRRILERLRGGWYRLEAHLPRISIIAAALLYVGAFGPLFLQLLKSAKDAGSRSPGDLKELLLAMGAVIGAPFLAWRTWIASNQAKAAHQSNIIGLFTKAVEQLGAEKDHIGLDGVSGKVANTEMRIGAILALERIGLDSPADYWRIMEVLSAYVRNNAPATIELRSGEENKSTQVPVEIQFAIDALGRRPLRGLAYENRNKLRIDLTGVNLAGVKFSRWYSDERGARSGNFSYVDFTRSVLDGCEFVDADIGDCIFDQSSLVETSFLGSRAQHATFHFCEAARANFSGADLRRADFQKCQLKEAMFGEADLRRAGFVKCQLDGAELSHVRVSGGGFVGNSMISANLFRVKFLKTQFLSNRLDKAIVVGCDFTVVEDMRNNNIEAAYGDITTLISEGQRPSSWPRRELSWEERRALEEGSA